MKRISDLRPCDNCGGPITPFFYVVRMSLAFIREEAVNQFIGMHRFFGGRASPALVENFAPAAATGVKVAGDEEPTLMTELVICQRCYLDQPIDLALLTERRSQAHNAKEVRAVADEPNEPETPAAEQVSDDATGATTEPTSDEESDKPDTTIE
jgi:hypothetical protein